MYFSGVDNSSTKRDDVSYDVPLGTPFGKPMLGVYVCIP